MMASPNPSREVTTIAGGCFWCLQPIFQELRGVEKVEVGYSGGRLANPSYEAVCTDTTGHAEAVQIAFDPQTIPLVDLLRIFFSVHDPTAGYCRVVVAPKVAKFRKQFADRLKKA